MTVRMNVKLKAQQTKTITAAPPIFKKGTSRLFQVQAVPQSKERGHSLI